MDTAERTSADQMSTAYEAFSVSGFYLSDGFAHTLRAPLEVARMSFSARRTRRTEPAWLDRSLAADFD